MTWRQGGKPHGTRPQGLGAGEADPDFGSGKCVFHLQQAAEKLAKAVLTVEGIMFGVGHQIGALAGALPGDNVFRPDLASLDRFSSYATATRYPLPGGGMPRLPTKEFLDLGIHDVASLVDEIDDYRRERATGPEPK